MNRSLVAAGAVIALAAWVAVSTADAQDAENSHRIHCEMVAVWEADKAKGLAETERNGWPNFDKRECK